MLEFESLINIPTPVIEIFEDLFVENDVKVFVKRDDLTHVHVSGNKFRKLKYNFIEAKNLGFKKILTFGGAFSNHIAAVAEAGLLFGFETLGIIRGDELNETSSPTLKFANQKGMRFKFVSREAYRNKADLAANFSSEYFIIPEGGSNHLALKGVSELLDEQQHPDYICTAVGTGGTMAGLLNNVNYKGEVLGFAVLKNGDFLKDDISVFLEKNFPENAELETRFHFGGYAKYNDELLDFVKVFELKHSFRLEQVYTGKMFFGVYQKIKEGYFKKGTRIMLLHTGGLQGRLSDL
ncbi:1-aminocyclopropane-1-carboxylate deaminase/D-cysteine desulfhydrase [Lacihabitans soyangensis]|uniref:1-aminocyclopropane-1-carboxylate deaminase/D-cysteine desulfhydrase n=1 Tax=Lacihabitans soyangensis TaxID=869394 RepID=A0AAE3H6Q0_9BACT|nr:pyridoxal-phosphate dependent enzyme [Lacihabitans soyangensis]MCP9765872.1 1-aminocyclopropane-1-carboxylate deaminase/D-cysteine desulfhydrase [Lacihabitans soyangensis]